MVDTTKLTAVTSEKEKDSPEKEVKSYREKRRPVLDELNDTPPPEMFIRGCLLGPTGSGKTQSLATLPSSPERPGLLVDFDNRWETLRDEIEKGLVKPLTIFDEDPDSAKGWDKAERLRKELWAIARKGEFPYSWIAEDGLSAMARLAMNSALTLDNKRGLGGAPAKQHWMPQIHYLIKHINSMRNLPCHYVICGHLDFASVSYLGYVVV